MENLIKHFNSIDTSFRKMKFVTVLSLICAAVIAVGSVAASGWFMEKSNGTIYVVDKGSAVMATRSQEDSHRELEARDHVTRFHELMLNLSPSAESIQRIVSANISQEFVADSIKVDMLSYPHQVTTYGKLYLLRESNITAYQFESSCRLVEVERSQNNPHGLMIERFTVTRNENIGTRKRH